MNVTRGEIWLADLDPTQGSEQAGFRPVLVMQNNAINRSTTTVLCIPLTGNLRRAKLPTCVQVAQGEGGLASDSVVLCHQTRVLDKTRLKTRLGSLSEATLLAVEARLLFTLGIS